MFSANNCDMPEFQAFFLIVLLSKKPVLQNIITVRTKNIITAQLTSKKLPLYTIIWKKIKPIPESRTF